MIRALDEQLELDFKKMHEPPEQTPALPPAQTSASIICLTPHLYLRRAREVEAEDAQLLERITSRVRHFK